MQDRKPGESRFYYWGGRAIGATWNGLNWVYDNHLLAVLFLVLGIGVCYTLLEILVF